MGRKGRTKSIIRILFFEVSIILDFKNIKKDQIFFG
jgi:hypothetical protein